MSCPTPADFNNCRNKCVCRYSDCQGIATTVRTLAEMVDPQVSTGNIPVLAVFVYHRLAQDRQILLTMAPVVSWFVCRTVFRHQWKECRNQMDAAVTGMPGGIGTEGSAFAILSPNMNGGAAGFICDNTGAASTVYPWGGGAISSLVAPTSDYCGIDPTNVLGHRMAGHVLERS